MSQHKHDLSHLTVDFVSLPRSFGVYQVEMPPLPLMLALFIPALVLHAWYENSRLQIFWFVEIICVRH